MKKPRTERREAASSKLLFQDSTFAKTSLAHAKNSCATCLGIRGVRCVFTGSYVLCDPRGPLHKVTQSPQARAEGSKAATRTTLCLALLALGRRFAMHARRALPPPLSCLGLPQCLQSRVFAWSFNTHASPRLPGSSFFPRHGLGQRPNCRPFLPTHHVLPSPPPTHTAQIQPCRRCVGLPWPRRRP